MPTTRRHTDPKPASRKGSLRNAAALTLSQVTKLVNLPVAQDVARHIHQITVALKAPKTNDLGAKELADQVAGLLDVLDAALPHLDNTAELDALYDRLKTAHAELESIQTSEYMTKLASQNRIRDQIAKLKEEMSRTVTDLTLRLLLITLAGNMRDSSTLLRTRKLTISTHKTTLRTQRATVRQQGALVRAEQRLTLSNQRIEELERMCAALQCQGAAHEVILMRYTDGQGISYPVLALNVTLFFFRL
ncbi:hypothetical protein ACGC1H_003068 [Rhizoctonia solani]